MSEEEAIALIETIVGSAGVDRLRRLVDLVLIQNAQQNLIAASTVDHIWARHVLDSVQLLQWSAGGETWLDVGTGGGFPGLAIAVVDDRPMTLAEPRRRRAEFLTKAAEQIGLTNVDVQAFKVEQVDDHFDLISARAVASMGKILQLTAGCVTAKSRWLLLRGRVDPDELNSLRESSGMMFHVKQSLSDPSSGIVIVESRRS